MRKLNVTAKPASAAKPAKLAKPAKPVAVAAAPVATVATAEPAPVAVAVTADKPARAPAGIARTASTIAAMRCNFGALSDRDEAYFSFYASLAKASPDGTVTVRAIAESGRAPRYTGSAKPHDAGAIQRLHKAGIIATSADGAGFTFTDGARGHKLYASA